MSYSLGSLFFGLGRWSWSYILVIGRSAYKIILIYYKNIKKGSHTTLPHPPPVSRCQQPDNSSKQ